MNRQKSRNSAVELLRIFSMLMIVGCHFATYGGFSFSADDLSLSRFLFGIWELGGNIGTDIFVLISGYYLIENDTLFVKREKVILLWGQIFFYSILLFAVSFLIGQGDFSLKNIIRTLLPVTFSRWWFASAYFLLYLLHPYLNRFLRSLTRAEYRRFLAVLLFLFCVIPTFTGALPCVGELMEFAVLYALSAYIRLHESEKQRSVRGCLFRAAVCCGILYLSYGILVLLGTKNPIFSALSLWFYLRTSVFTVGCALFLLLAFLAMKPFENRILNTISSAAFGVYLIHEYPAVRTLLWGKLFCGAAFDSSPFLLLFWAGATVLVYVGCTAIELFRKQCLEKPFAERLEKKEL